MVNIPYVPFDPTEVGPTDVVASWYHRIMRRWRVVLIVLGALAVLAYLFDVSFPSFREFVNASPNWLMVGILVTLLAAYPYYILGSRVADGVYTREVVRLVEVRSDPALNIYRLEPETFAKMTVVNQNGDEKGLDFLEEIPTNGHMAYEVEAYDPEQNLAVASWLAGATNVEIRARREKIDQVKTDLEAEADRAVEFLAKAGTILRSQGKDLGNFLIREVEGVEHPNGETLHDNLTKAYEEIGSVEDLLGLELEDVNGQGDLEAEGEPIAKEVEP